MNKDEKYKQKIKFVIYPLIAVFLIILAMLVDVHLLEIFPKN